MKERKVNSYRTHATSFVSRRYGTIPEQVNGANGVCATMASEIPGDRLRNKERNPKLCMKKVEEGPMSLHFNSSQPI